LFNRAFFRHLELRRIARLTAEDFQSFVNDSLANSFDAQEAIEKCTRLPKPGRLVPS
jgi:hypothetical protein